MLYMTDNIFEEFTLAQTNLKPQRSSCLTFSVAQSQCLILMRETYIILHVSKNKVIFAHSSAVYDLDVSSGSCLLQ